MKEETVNSTTSKALPPDSAWFSIYITKPKNGQNCMSKIEGEQGYAGSCVFNDGYFESYDNQRNRLIITRWKHNLWLPIELTLSSPSSPD